MGKTGMFKPLAGSAAKTPVRGERGEWRPLWPAPPDPPTAPAEHPTLGRPADVWTYRTATGALGGYVCRYDTAEGGKEFRPLTYCEHSGTRDREWRWKAFAPLRPLYGLDRLAKRPAAPVVVCEGEKAADAVERLLSEYVAVTSPGGSNAPGKADWGVLAHRRVVIWPDADAAGCKYAAAVARRLTQTSAQVSIITPPEGAPEGWDAADAEAEGWDHARALALVDAAAPADGAMRAGHDPADGSAADGGAEKPKTKGGGFSPPQRNLIIEAIGDVALWHSPDREAFASVPVNGHVENWAVRSRDFRIWLAGRYFAEYGGAPGGQAVQDALAVLEAKAIHRGPCYPTWRRVAGHNGAIYHDLADPAWRAVEITADGWRVVDRPPVKFLRSAAMRPLPAPEAGGLIEGLRGFVNLETDADFQLLVGWLVGALRPQGPFPILILNGEQGSAKSTTARVLRALIDPNVAPIRAAPRDERDLSVAADNNWAIVLDNLSGLPWWLSDALCRIATGGGFATRELHTNREEIVLSAVRPIALNGITALDTRPDLGDRALVVVLPAITEGERRTEAEFWADCEAMRPTILGTLYDAVSCALRCRGERKVAGRLRMADFVEWIEAAAHALGWADGAFTEVYAENQATAVHNVLEDNPLARAIREVADELGEWEGAAIDFLPVLDARVTDSTRKHRSWPATGQALGGALRRLAPALRTVGVDVSYLRVGHARQRTWIIQGRADQ